MKGETPASLLILIPAYNEEERIEPVLRDYAEYFGKYYGGKFQIVVVLNGCRDNTLGVVERVATEFPAIQPLEFREPIGKVQAGFCAGIALQVLSSLETNWPLSPPGAVRSG